MKIEMNEYHQYFVDGQPTMSVTQIIRNLFPNKYKGVPENTLKKAADRGNKIHAMIEKYALSHMNDDRTTLELEGINYPILEKKNEIAIASCEKQVAYIDEETGKPLYCGTYDMLGLIGNDKALLDIKTTAQADINYLKWQLTMYALAVEQMQSLINIKKLACIWMPKNGIGEYILIKRLKDNEVIEEVKEIVKSQ